MRRTPTAGRGPVGEEEVGVAKEAQSAKTVLEGAGLLLHAGTGHAPAGVTVIVPGEPIAARARVYHWMVPGVLDEVIASM